MLEHLRVLIVMNSSGDGFACARHFDDVVFSPHHHRLLPLSASHFCHLLQGTVRHASRPKAGNCTRLEYAASSMRIMTMVVMIMLMKSEAAPIEIRGVSAGV